MLFVAFLLENRDNEWDAGEVGWLGHSTINTVAFRDGEKPWKGCGQEGWS